MDEQRQWSVVGWALVAGALAFAICCGLSATVAEGRRLMPQTAVQTTMQTMPKACLDEVDAYATVAGVADRMGPTRDILDFALDDLEARLVTCLRDDARTARDVVSGWL